MKKKRCVINNREKISCILVPHDHWGQMKMLIWNIYTKSWHCSPGSYLFMEKSCLYQKWSDTSGVFFCPINLTIVSECRKKNCKQSHTDFCSFFGRVGVTQLTGKTRLRLWSWRLTSSRYYVVESVVIAVYDQSLVYLLENQRYRYPGSDDGSDVGVALAHERILLGTAVRWWRYEV
jgi:hypothetical protein